MKQFILMMQFLTKYPLPFQLDVDEDDFTKGAIWFPVVGLVIGLTLWGLYELTSGIDSILVRAVLVVALEIFLTGGLHLDGLADTFDGLYSYRDKSRMLEIMKDSRVGTNGVLVLVVSILLKVGLITLVNGPAIILMPVFGRYMGMVLAGISKYAREKGMGGFFIGKLSAVQMVTLTTLTLVISSLSFEMMLLLPILLLMTLVFRWHVYSKIDGVTGDVIGCWIELTELLFLLMVVMI